MALVWVLFVGVVASVKGSPEGIWFKSCLDKACGKDGLIMQRLESMIGTQKHGTPNPFFWMLQEDWLRLSSVKTKIL
jgi:hypothetical protein